MSIYLGNKLISTARIATTDKVGVVKPDGISIFITDEGTLSANVSQIKTGSVIFFAGNVIPEGYLECYGQAVSRTVYAELFNVIGTIYGSGNGSTTFNIPNLVNRFIQGSNTSGTVKQAGLPNITGQFSGTESLYKEGYTPSPSGAFYQSAFNVVAGWSTNDQFDNNVWSFSASRSSSIYGRSTTVQPPALTMLPIIKY